MTDEGSGATTILPAPGNPVMSGASTASHEVVYSAIVSGMLPTLFLSAMPQPERGLLSDCPAPGTLLTI